MYSESRLFHDTLKHDVFNVFCSSISWPHAFSYWPIAIRDLFCEPLLTNLTEPLPLPNWILTTLSTVWLQREIFLVCLCFCTKSGYFAWFVTDKVRLKEERKSSRRPSVWPCWEFKASGSRCSCCTKDSTHHTMQTHSKQLVDLCATNTVTLWRSICPLPGFLFVTL